MLGTLGGFFIYKKSKKGGLKFLYINHSGSPKSKTQHKTHE